MKDAAVKVKPKAPRKAGAQYPRLAPKARTLAGSSAARDLDSGGLGVLARKARRLRAAAGLTLQELSGRSGVSQSALSKIENGQLSPTYEKILALAKGLGVDVAVLFSDAETGTPMGRRGVTLKGRGVVHSSPQYDYEVLCPDVLRKQFLPLLTTVKAHSVQDFPTLPRHDGEEFVYVVRGQVTLHTEFYEPLKLSEGDCCYFDSTMGHGLVSGGLEDAAVLWVCSENVSLKRHEPS